MSFQHDDLDPTARAVRVQTEVPADPEEVWRAIATGPGIETWFVPAEVDEREGGRIVTHHGSFGSSVGTIVVWDPPHRLVYEEREWQEAPDPADPAPVWSTEIVVEAHAGGTCSVRLTSGFLADGERWEDELGGTDDGWARGIENLRRYLTSYAGIPVGTMIVSHGVAGRKEQAWAATLDALGLRDAAVGDRVGPAPGAPVLAGTVYDRRDAELHLEVSDPAPGLVELSVHEWSSQVNLSVRAYLYAENARAIAAAETTRWTTWLETTLGPSERRA